MKRITTTARPIYIDEYEPQYMPVQQTYEVVTIRRRRRRLADRVATAAVTGFVLGLGVLVLLCFVVKDVEWLIQRGAAALAIILLGGGALSMVMSFFEELRSVFLFLLGVDDD